MLILWICVHNQLKTTKVYSSAPCHPWSVKPQAFLVHNKHVGQDCRALHPASLLHDAMFPIPSKSCCKIHFLKPPSIFLQDHPFFLLHHLLSHIKISSLPSLPYTWWRKKNSSPACRIYIRSYRHTKSLGRSTSLLTFCSSICRCPGNSYPQHVWRINSFWSFCFMLCKWVM